MTKEKDQIPFIIAISFMAAFILIRLGVFIAGSAQSEFAAAAKVGEMPDVRFYIGRNIILFGYHIHHFYTGILLICVSGWMAINETKLLSRRQLAIMYGAGLGLFFDEIGLLLTWGDYYSHLSYLLSLFMIGLFANIIYFSRFWQAVKENIAKAPPTSNVARNFFRFNSFIKAADYISEKTGNSTGTAMFFTGLIYIIISFTVFKFPQFVRYLIAVAFFIRGVNYVFRHREIVEEGRL